jgi:ATP-dependent RNA helicase DeaD
MTDLTFSQLGLSDPIIKSLSEMGFEAPTAIQAECIPHILEGRDIVGQAQTGTGKTAAFGIPLLEKVDLKQSNIQVVVQCPTRELAIQVTGELMKIGRFMNGLHVVPVYGGQPISRQITALKRGAQVLVGTPGRTLDHLKRGTLKLDNLKMLVFDEADEMLNMGFREDMEALLKHVDQEIQTVMFSATVPPFIREIMKRFMKNPENVTIDRKAVTAPDIKQYVVEIRDSMRTEAISRLMDVNNFKLAIVFCNTKRATESLTQELQSRGYACDILNGDLNQTQRDKVMNAFRKGQIDILVATDVAARGIDVDDVDVIFNFELPTDPEYYVHRIGRTGRAGRSGTSITFSAPNKSRKLRFIESQIKQRLETLPMPSIADVTESRIAIQLKDVTEALEQGGLKPYIDQLEQFAANGFPAIEVAAALLKLRSNTGTAGADEDFSKSPNIDRNAPKTTLKFNVGKKDKVSPGDFVGAIAGECNVPIEVIGHINILQYESFVDVNSDVADHVLNVMGKAKIKGNRVQVFVDEGRPGGGSSSRSSSGGGGRSYGRERGGERGGEGGGASRGRRPGGSGRPTRKRRD